MIQQLMCWGRRYWVFLSALALLALAFGVAAPAWAAPPSAYKYQTVPEPTPTSGVDPVATATPRPGADDDDDGDTGDGANQGSTNKTAPVFVIGQEQLGGVAGAAQGLTASVAVATLNVREGPGIEYAIVGSLAEGDVVSVLWRNDRNTWLFICCIPGTTTGGWVSALLLNLDFDRSTSADIIPVFVAGAETGGAPPAETEVTAAAEAPDATITILLNMSMSPPLIRQGETGLLVLDVANPNREDAVDVELSDQLPPQLELVSASATGQGIVSRESTAEGSPLVLANWSSIPAGDSVRLVLTVKVADGLEDGAVFDNLAAVRGANTAYASGAVTIGMPPSLLPDFQ